MALTIINSIADFLSYDNTNADIIMVRDAKRTSGNHFIWNGTITSGNNGTLYLGLSVPGVWQMMYDGPINVEWFGAEVNLIPMRNQA